MVRDVLLPALGDQVQGGEGQRRDPHGAPGPIGQALKKVSAHEGLLPGALEHVAPREDEDEHEPHGGAAGSQIRAPRAGSPSDPQGVEDDGEADGDEHRESGPRQEGARRPAVERQARGAQRPVVRAAGEHSGEQEVEDQWDQRQDRPGTEDGDQVVRGQRVAQRGDEVGQERGGSGGREGDEGQHHARPPGRAAAGLRGLGLRRRCGARLSCHAPTLRAHPRRPRVTGGRIPGAGS